MKSQANERFRSLRLCRPRVVRLRLARDDPNLPEAVPRPDWRRHSLESTVMRSGKAWPYRTGGGIAEEGEPKSNRALDLS